MLVNEWPDPDPVPQQPAWDDGVPDEPCVQLNRFIVNPSGDPETLAQPSLMPTYVDPEVYPGRMIDGHFYQRCGSAPCECGRPMFLILELSDRPPISKALFNENVFGGREIITRIPGGCPSCRAVSSLITQRPNLRTFDLDRGFHRSVILDLVARCEAKSTRMGDLEAEILQEIVDSHPGDWIPTTAFTGHAHAATVANVLATIPRNAVGPEASFSVGTVVYEVGRIMPQVAATLLDRHASGDHGLYGLVATSISEETAWIPQHASIPEQNFLSSTQGDGPVRSIYLMPEKINGHKHHVEICTFLEGKQKSTTYILSNVVC